MKNMKYPLWAKIFAFIISIVSIAATVGSVVLAIYCMSAGIYHKDKSEAIYTSVNNAAYARCLQTANKILNDELYYDFIEKDNSNIVFIELLDENNNSVYLFKNESLFNDSAYEFSYNIFVDTINKYAYPWHENINEVDATMWTARIGVAEELYRFDEFKLYSVVDKMAVRFKYTVYPICVIALILTIFSCSYLYSTIGKKSKNDAPVNNWATSIPSDLALIIYGVIFICLLSFVVAVAELSNLLVQSFCAVLLSSALLAFAQLFILSVILRCKTKTIFTNSIIYRILRSGQNGVVTVIKNKKISAVVIGAIIVLGIVELILFTLAASTEPALFIILLVIEKIVLAIVCLKLLLPLQQIKDAAEVLAKGDLSYKMDTTKMVGPVKEHAEALNNIASGLGIAVNERLKSERMKTELITNVSHDIKTPLTSIINYTDLIEKERTDNIKISEYTQVLRRQAEKLKRLIEDLVEASKASSGSLEVMPVPCEANVFVNQAEGEYQEKFEAANLTLITKVPEESCKIMADGRRMWRVFDNLLNNICKYSAPGTRVYLSLEQVDDSAVISFKNTSREPLDMTPDELLERFVRGDKSRNTEGNGLGLSIAKSLTELQNGTFDVSTDGDLFKVILKFPLC